jgi:hypothetical protein
MARGSPADLESPRPSSPARKQRTSRSSTLDAGHQACRIIAGEACHRFRNAADPRWLAARDRDHRVEAAKRFTGELPRLI